MINDAETSSEPTESIPTKLARALRNHTDRIAMVDCDLTVSYGQLADSIDRLRNHLPAQGAVAIFGKPTVAFSTAAIACVVLGRPFVHLDPAMPADVLTNIIAGLEVEVIFQSETPKPGQFPDHCTCVNVPTVIANCADAPTQPIVAADVAPDDIIYFVATAGTTGKPKCIPVSHQSAYLSYEWRDAYTPYDTTQTIGIYIFAIWEMFRPLRDGAKLCFPQFRELMDPNKLIAFLKRHQVTEMLFTPSALEMTLQTCAPAATQNVPLKRIILNGEVVSDDLIAAVRAKLPEAALWNLYSICETHDISMTKVSDTQARTGAASVGIPMPHLKAIVLDDNDEFCDTGQPGFLHFEGSKMLGPGYVNRPNETALRFREMTLNGRETRLYDTGDQGYVAADGSVHVIGRVAHMLKLRGHSIQTQDLTESLHAFVGFTQAVPWIQDVAGQGKALVFYYCADAAQTDANRKKWGLEAGGNRTSASLSKALRAELPAYCIPSYLVQLDAMPINAVSGKCDFKLLPPITLAASEQPGDAGVLPIIARSAEVMGCPASALDPDLSFHDQGGDSLMAVTLLLALEGAYGCRVDFDFALNVPLGRLHEILTTKLVAPRTKGSFTRPGIFLTGVTGFLGSRVLAAAARGLPDDQVIYCLIRPKRRDHVDRLRSIAIAHGVDPERLIAVPAAIEDACFNLHEDDYQALTTSVRSVIHCAAMVNLAVDSDHMQAWSRAGIANILQFCSDAGADLRFSSSTAVFADSGGPYVEGATEAYLNCSGYGAAKIEAEQQIAASNVPTAIVRLPSLYDQTAPNPNDIYEIIMSACAQMRAVPEGFSFRMIDVHAAAHFLVNVPLLQNTRYFNLTPEVYVTTALIPATASINVVPVAVWLRDAPISAAEQALIAADTSVLRADAKLTHTSAKAVWEMISDQAFEAISDPAGLITQRLSRRNEQAA